jgi:L,D-peptidoglycan transpeptidase YkuD (ErfK/YbiS/YcfS/YnhG family)
MIFHDLIVRQSGEVLHRGSLIAADRTFACSLGQNGLTCDKREGDGATPVGSFPLRRVLYRADRFDRPRTALPVSAITPNDGWCDFPSDSAYNRPVRLPYASSAESLWREDRLYDVVIVVGHNDDPAVPGSGSAIFLHLTTADYPPTAGCVALVAHDMVELLPQLGEATRLVVRSGDG